MDAEELLKIIRPLEATTRVCVRGDLLADRSDLERQIEIAIQRDGHPSLGSVPASHLLAQRLEALLQEIDENTHKFRFRALPRSEFRALQERHPPREGNEIDKALGGNIETFPQDLIAACCIDPAMTPDQLESFLDVLSDGQIMELFGCALGLNRSQADFPKFETASSILERLAPRSRRLAPGGSPGGGSSAGSLAG